MAGDDSVNILVVDDLPEKLLVIETVLAELGENVITARSGEEALARILEKEFAVILMDVNMPGLNGLQTAELIRKRKRSSHIPIIFITAFADEMHTAKGYSLGAVDYILSPVVPEILRSKVRVFVDLYRMARQVRQSVEERVALAREQAARGAAEEATRRSVFLAEASASLSSSLNVEATARCLAGAAVPFLADLAAVTLITEGEPGAITEVAWQDHAGTVLNQEYPGYEYFLEPLQVAIQRVIREGRSDLVRDLPWPEALTNGDRPPNGNATVLPLLARGKTLGALILFLGPSGRHFEPEDLATAEHLVGRAAVALDNARLYQDLQDADRRKNEFLSMLAHELRNPLAPIRNAVQLMRMQVPREPELQWARDVIDRQVQHMVRMVDDLLDVSRITRGKIRLQAEILDVETVINRAVETSRPLIDARKHRLRVEFPSSALHVKGDLARLSQVLANLLNNAAKYTPEGGELSISAEAAEDSVLLRVRDNGIGIPAPMLGSIFDLFTQVDRSLDRSEGGLGIGLTLVRHLVEMHQGRVHAYSAGSNQGSEFVIQLPLQVPVAAPEPRPLELPAPALASGVHKVLVVDDNRDAAESLALLLRIDGHEVRTVHDGPSALREAKGFVPDVVLLDIGLPGMDGYEVGQRMRNEPETAECLMLALTGYGQDQDRRRSLEAGFDQHLVKPIEPTVLADILARGKPARDKAKDETPQMKSAVS